jgi:hypothetical protein
VAQWTEITIKNLTVNVIKHASSIMGSKELFGKMRPF